MLSLAIDMEVPLNDALDYVHALKLIGEGMEANYGDEGRPIEILARSARDRLDALKETWNKMFEPLRRRHRP